MHISLNGIQLKKKRRQRDVSWGVFDASKGIHSDKYKLAREQMRKGLRVPCVKYVRREAKGAEESRTRYLIEYLILLQQRTKTVDSIDIKFDRTCNLGCRMCNPYSSSFLNKELDKIAQQDRFAQEETEWDTDYAQDNKLELCKQLVKKGLKVFKTTGGEPFLQRHFIEFVDWCIENKYNDQLTLKITTNLTLAD